jgi:Flp pilus assembly protein TadD
MRTRLGRFLLGILLLAPLANSLQCAELDLRMDRLQDSINLLGSTDKAAVEQAVALIRKGENTLALARLSALNNAHPDNSSLRILSAYALLQVGNFLGAFDEAQKAEKAPNGNSYKCWFLGKVALLAGDKAVCKREIKHVKSVGDMAADVHALEKELKKH